MRLLAIGDIHGCARAFDTLMVAVQPTADDRIITLGDYVDRGPDSKGVLNRMIALHETGLLVALRGNHELMMLRARSDQRQMRFWRDFGGKETLASYARPGAAGTLQDVPKQHWNFIENVCLDYYETATHFFVHANAYDFLPLSAQPEEALYWERFDEPEPHISGKTMICGHTSQKTGVPANLGHAICIDTWVYGGGWLSCLDVTSGRFWQANQAGEQRSASIDDFRIG